jgi:predicted nuclease with RNAse H fold
MHLGSRHEFSTFRLSLGSILARARGESEIDEAALTLWMHNHLRVIAIPVNDADILNNLETAVLAVLDPPLNLAKMQRTPVRKRLAELRRQYGHRSR